MFISPVFHDWHLEGKSGLVFGLLMGVVLIVAVLVLAWALAAGIWMVQHGEVRPQRYRSDYDSRRPRP
jgi:uncharacterized membrane protein YdbT with pleckstrin-like domain